MRPEKFQAWSGSNLFDSQMVFLKDLTFKTLIFLNFLKLYITMGFSIKFDTFKSEWSIVYIER